MIRLSLILVSTLLFTPLMAAANTIVLTNVNYLDVSNLQVKEDATIVIQNGLIKQLIDKDSKAKLTLTEEDSSVTIDMQGKYVIPGLIDAHVHHATDPEGYDNYQDTAARLKHLLRGGVTGVRDMGGDARTLANLKRLASIDSIVSPDIYFSVIIGGDTFFADPRTVSSAKGQVPGNTVWMRSVNLDTNFDEVALKASGIGASGIKVYASVSADVLPPLYTAAKKHGLQVWSHATISPASPLDSVLAGVDVLSHGPDLGGQVIDNYRDWRLGKFDISQEKVDAQFNASSYELLFQAMKQRDVVLDATMHVFEGHKDRNERRKLLYEMAKFIVNLAHNNGIKIGAGTDAFADPNRPDYVPLHDELLLLVEDAGLSAFEAIQSATLINAQALGIDETIGSIAPGKVANLVVLNESPIDDITNIGKIAHVMKNGKFIYRPDMPGLPFASARKAGGLLWMSGQIGNLPTTMALAGDSIEAQMQQTLINIGDVLRDHGLGYQDVVKCTLMLDDISEWAAANEVYKQFFNEHLPTRSAFGSSGLALGAKVEIECIAQL